MRETFMEYCRRSGKEALLAEWAEAENLPLTAQAVSPGSHQKVWWQCENGHTWQAVVYARSAGSGCPYCEKKRPQRQINDLLSFMPRLAAQWDPEKNAPLTPDQVSYGTHRIVWWRCEKGHSYRAAVKSRSRGTGCPYCAGRAVLAEENSLAACRPELAAQWDTEKNAPFLPSQVTAGSDKRVWWKCSRGHSWKASVSSRTHGNCGCPVCAGRTILPGFNDLQTVFPELAAQWDPDRNDALANTVSPYSNRRVWWKCSLGHSYLATVASRTQRDSGCPYCANRRVLPGFNDLAAVAPTVAMQWHPSRNGALTPQMVTPGSTRKVWWQCETGHEWRAVIYSRTGRQHCGCPYCAAHSTGRKSEQKPSYRRSYHEEKTMAVSAHSHAHQLAAESVGIGSP